MDRSVPHQQGSTWPAPSWGRETTVPTSSLMAPSVSRMSSWCTLTFLLPMWIIYVVDPSYCVVHSTVWSILCRYLFSLSTNNGVNIMHYNNNNFKNRIENFRVLLDLRDYYQDASVPKTVNIVLNSITDSLNVSFENGDILSIEHGSSEVTCVGCVVGGIRAMSWSPDQEVVSVVTGADNVLVLTGAFDPINEVGIHQEGFGEKQFITVGWGKKETQFHGSEGKAARNVTTQMETKLSDDEGLPSISWRGDGVLFAVSVVGPNDIRYIRVFNREGILQYTTKPMSGLGSALAWRPSGNVLAATQCLPQKYVVSFFEKNGLRHGDFLLPFDSCEVNVSSLLWNSDSSILTAVCFNNQQCRTSLYFWTVGNYHWYLKQVLEFPAGKKVFHVEWDSLHRNRLHVFHEDESILYTCYDWNWLVHCKSNATEEDGANVAVIDGANVLLTSFHQSVIPPPLCIRKLKLCRPVNTVMFPKENHEGICVVLSDGSVAALSASGEILWNCDVLWDNLSVQGYPPHHWLWLAGDTFVCYCSSCLVLLKHDTKQNKLVVRSSTPVEGAVCGVSMIPGSELILVQLKDGKLLTYNPSSLELKQYTFSLPECCVKLDVCRVDGMEVVFGLSNRNRFYMNAKEAANNVTSYVLHPHFLLLTTLQHTLLCCRLSTACIQELASGHVANTSRRVERGARLVVAIPHDTSVILQMPRGNLECIHPRPLLLHVAATLLNGREYCRVFQLMRKQRINLNLLCDHNLDIFLESVDHFVEDVHAPGWLSLFLSELQEEDVTRTLTNIWNHLCWSLFTVISKADTSVEYSRRCRSGCSVVQPFKVKVVCEAVRKALLAHKDADGYLLPVLTSHVKQGSTEDLEAALLRIKAVKQTSTKYKSEGPFVHYVLKLQYIRHVRSNSIFWLFVFEEGGNKLAVSAADALKHVLYLVDVNELYDVALGMYDFDLVQLVAAKSQKDPKEYLPFLNQLLSFDPDYRKFCINKHLRRYESALKHIVCCSDNNKHFQECLTLVKEHKLYDHALMLFKRKGTQYCQVAVLYAEYLQEQKKWDEAAIMFQRGRELSRALQCYLAAGSWRQALLLANEMGYRQLNELYRDLVKRLCEWRQYGDAAEILSQLLGDVEESIAVLVQGHLWPQAVWAAHSAKRKDLIGTSIMHYTWVTFDRLSKLSCPFKRPVPRLTSVGTEQTDFGEVVRTYWLPPAPGGAYNLAWSIRSFPWVDSTILDVTRMPQHIYFTISYNCRNYLKLSAKLLSNMEGNKHIYCVYLHTYIFIITTVRKLQKLHLEGITRTVLCYKTLSVGDSPPEGGKQKKRNMLQMMYLFHQGRCPLGVVLSPCLEKGVHSPPPAGPGWEEVRKQRS
ncbi:hypothetical protein PR048_003609 [Dryococelus australis]|uniref:Elongator complex protein 1 n=1 Tax=Dryococelus australis TaxID=614101 RepID=A0ABQ9INM5_9NEOP|nr:hypothetical protein PR048_003609 [Dryococelus australis]